MPEAGKVKTRLVPPLSPQGAAELYRRMLADTVNKIDRFDQIDKLLFYEGGSAAREYFGIAAPSLRALPQRGKDLGERMKEAFGVAFSMGYDGVVIIGTDSPDLPDEYVTQAFRLLEETDVVFGPAEDGGYYLLGMKSLSPGLFESIPWSTSEVYRSSIEAAGRLRLKTAVLPFWHDIDTEPDLYRPEYADSGSAPLTRRFLDDFRGSRPVPAT
jgi:rSAM/selenodomain-associated transferase 1